MDPITALSVAAAAVGFFDSVYGLLKDTGTIRLGNKKLLIEELDDVIKDLVSFNATMQTQLEPVGNENDALASHQQALSKLLGDCSATARGLIEMLRSLRPGIQKGRWSTLLQAIKAVWKTRDIKKLVDDVGLYKSQLIIRMLGYMNAKMDEHAEQQGRQLSSLQRNDSEIVEILTLTQKNLIAHLNERSAQTSKQLEVLEAKLVLKNGECKTLPQMELSNPTHPDGALEHVSLMAMKAPSSTNNAEASTRDFSQVHKMIVQCLRFREMMARLETMKSAHQQTFNWIFSHPQQTGKPWSDFVNWLQKDSGCYWISGKAGSGKSTLMKYICGDQRTKNHLRVWAQQRTLITPAFFFWYLGSTLQKSQAGLLRVLLSQVIEAEPQLVTTLMPELAQEASKLLASEGSLLCEPSTYELIMWMKRLGKLTAPSHRICFFIDGLDEYTGDHAELIETLLTITTDTPSIKFVFSSRPITACVDAFTGCPCLHVQDLTLDDIRVYVETNLSNRLKGKGLLDQDCQLLISSIARKSSGVFMWVCLVVKSLLAGLRDGDTFAELETRLEVLPGDLRELYQHMFARIPKNYRAQASELIQLVLSRLQALGWEDKMPLSSLQMSFAMESWNYVQNQPMAPISIAEVMKRNDQVDARLRSRCLGFLEINLQESAVGDRDVYNACSRRTVGFIHKSAVEFLTSDDVHEQLVGLTDGSDFHPLELLFRSCLLSAKCVPTIKIFAGKDNERWLWSKLTDALSFANAAEMDGQPIAADKLNLLNSVYNSHWSAADAWMFNPSGTLFKARGHWIRRGLGQGDDWVPQEKVPRSTFHPACLNDYTNNEYIEEGIVTKDNPYNAKSFDNMIGVVNHRLSNSSDKLSFGYIQVIYSLASSIRELYPPMGVINSKSSRQSATKLLQLYVFVFYCLVVVLPSHIPHPAENSTVCEILLMAGADPNAQVFKKQTTWTLLLISIYCQSMEPRNWLDIEDKGRQITVKPLYKIIEIFIHHNANLRAKVKYDGQSWTASEFLKFTIERLQDSDGDLETRAQKMRVAKSLEQALPLIKEQLGTGRQILKKLGNTFLGKK